MSFEDEYYEMFGNENSEENPIEEILNKHSNVFIDCKHDNTFTEGGLNICVNCGCEVYKIDHDSEWRFYGSGNDNSRCHKQKEVIKGGIKSVFVDARIDESLINDSLIKRAEDKYRYIVDGKTVRGIKRKSIVAACILYVMREDGDIRTSDEIRKMFGLTKQDMSEGMKMYHERFPADRVRPINPSDLIRRTMQRTGINISHYKNILRIAKVIENSNEILNRSSPQSVAPAIVYLYICMLPKKERDLIGLTKAKFAAKVDLSDITISKLVKVAASVVNFKFDD